MNSAKSIDDAVGASFPPRGISEIDNTDEFTVPSGHGSEGSLFSLEDTLIGSLADKMHTAICVFTLPVMTVLICAEVILRFVFNSATSWSQEACGICFFVLVLCCQANCWQKDRHIRMDLFYNYIPNRFKKIVDMLSIISGTVFFGAIGLQAFKDIPYQLAVNESTDEMHIPMWLLSGIVIISTSFLVGVLLRYSFRLAAKSKRTQS